MQVALCAFQRDPAIWHDADAFVPERWLDGAPEAAGRPEAAWMAFGNGVRNCVGMRMAQAEAKLTIALLYQRCVRQDKFLRRVSSWPSAPGNLSIKHPVSLSNYRPCTINSMTLPGVGRQW